MKMVLARCVTPPPCGSCPHPCRPREPPPATLTTTTPRQRQRRPTACSPDCSTPQRPRWRARAPPFQHSWNPCWPACSLRPPPSAPPCRLRVSAPRGDALCGRQTGQTGHSAGGTGPGDPLSGTLRLPQPPSSARRALFSALPPTPSPPCAAPHPPGAAAADGQGLAVTTLLHAPAGGGAPAPAPVLHSEALAGGVCSFHLASPPSGASLQLMHAFMQQLADRLQLAEARNTLHAKARRGAAPAGTQPERVPAGPAARLLPVLARPGWLADRLAACPASAAAGGGARRQPAHRLRLPRHPHRGGGAPGRRHARRLLLDERVRPGLCPAPV